jgi:adenylate kinase
MSALCEQIKERSLHAGRDEEFDAFILDEDKVCDELEDMMTEGGQVCKVLTR